MNRDKIRRELKQVGIEGSDLEDLTKLIHKYSFPEEYHYQYVESKIGSKGTSNDYLSYAKYLYQRGRSEGSPSISTIKQKFSYLSNYNLEAEDLDIEDLFRGDEEQGEAEMGLVHEEAVSRGHSGNSYTSFVYNSYLAIRAYLKAKGRKEQLSQLPDTEEFTKPDKVPRRHYISQEQVELLAEQVEKNESYGLQEELVILLGFYSGMRIAGILQTKKGWIHLVGEKADQRGMIELPGQVTKSGDAEVINFNRRISQKVDTRIKQIEDEAESSQAFLIDLINREVFVKEDQLKTEERIAKERDQAIKFLDDLTDQITEADIEDDYEPGNTTFEEFADNDGPNLTPHVLRHSFLQHVDQAKGFEAAFKLGRHEEIETTKLYLRSKQHEIGNLYEKIF